eukprot:5177786-Amphidinium_carterae.2
MSRYTLWATSPRAQERVAQLAFPLMECHMFIISLVELSFKIEAPPLDLEASKKQYCNHRPDRILSKPSSTAASVERYVNQSRVLVLDRRVCLTCRVWLNIGLPSMLASRKSTVSSHDGMVSLHETHKHHGTRIVFCTEALQP